MSRDTQEPVASQPILVYRAVTVSGRSFQIVRLHRWFVTPCDGPYNPTVQARWFGLFRVRSPLLAESLLFSLPVGTEMVHFPTLSSLHLWIQLRDDWAFTQPRFRIRTFPDHRSRATPRSFSQLTTSFIAAISQGIRRQPFVTWPSINESHS